MWLKIKGNPALFQFLTYLAVTLFSLLVCAIYYIFSHGMKDIHLTLLFLPGFLASLLFFIAVPNKIRISKACQYSFNMAFPFLWVYMLLNGVYNIAKTKSIWVNAFLMIAIALFCVSLTAFVIGARKGTKVEKE